LDPTIHLLLCTNEHTKISNSSQISSKHKSIHTGISKLGKQIEKNFTSSYSNLIGTSAMNDEASRVNLTKSIIEHLYCSGYSDIAKTLENESKIDLYSGDTKKKELFIELATMITAIRNGDFETSLSWIQQNRDKINPSSHFEWKIHRCQYCRMLLEKDSKLEDLIAISRLMTSSKSENQEESDATEVAKLMSALLFRKNLESNEDLSQFVNSFANSIAEICDELIR
jgi:hypothetical protein